MSVIIELVRKEDIRFINYLPGLVGRQPEKISESLQSTQRLNGDQLESRTPTKHELLKFVRHLREEKGMASSSLWTIYNMINSDEKL